MKCYVETKQNKTKKGKGKVWELIDGIFDLQWTNCKVNASFNGF